MNNLLCDSNFFYEHIGHMQFSVLTLKTYESIYRLTSGKPNVFVGWNNVRELIERNGFSRRQAEGELERFCYGYECTDRFNGGGVHEVALTNIGIGFLDNLLSESYYQRNEIVLLVRLAKRQNYFSTTIQESTFFKPEVYNTIESFKFRPGGAREFMRSIHKNELLVFTNVICQKLSHTISTDESSLDKVIGMVQDYGKYWASVGGKYSWFVFPQIFSLPFDVMDWSIYGRVIEKMIRPPEWGGGVSVSHDNLVKLLESDSRLLKFRNSGIVRPIWKSKNFEDATFCLTAPGYLMWERKKKGFLWEFRIRRLNDVSFEISLCNAFDFPKHSMDQLKNFTTASVFPTFRFCGNLNEIHSALSNLLGVLESQPEIQFGEGISR